MFKLCFGPLLISLDEKSHRFLTVITRASVHLELELPLRCMTCYCTTVVSKQHRCCLLATFLVTLPLSLRYCLLGFPCLVNCRQQTARIPHCKCYQVEILNLLSTCETPIVSHKVSQNRMILRVSSRKIWLSTLYPMITCAMQQNYLISLVINLLIVSSFSYPCLALPMWSQFCREYLPSQGLALKLLKATLKYCLQSDLE
mmetsp:Transcript_31601/g.53892  ORF Transcript_31601/g.53892 Transcript_31601/m.53892 type:complete len:201 (+) Transcript_31601:869-1471(+)